MCHEYAPPHIGRIQLVYDFGPSAVLRFVIVAALPKTPRLVHVDDVMRDLALSKPYGRFERLSELTRADGVEENASLWRVEIDN
jgi:hypothetical protein